MLDNNDDYPAAINGSDRVEASPRSAINGEKGSPGSGTGTGTGSMEYSQASVDVQAEQGNPGRTVKVKEDTA